MRIVHQNPATAVALLLCLTLGLSACASTTAAVAAKQQRHPLPSSQAPVHPWVIGPHVKELSPSELLSFKTERRPGPGARFIGADLIGTFRGHRFVAEYICSDVCPQYTVTVYHFVDLKTPADCAAIGAGMQEEMVPWGIGIRKRSFCMPTREMKALD